MYNFLKKARGGLIKKIIIFLEKSVIKLANQFNDRLTTSIEIVGMKLYLKPESKLLRFEIIKHTAFLEIIVSVRFKYKAIVTQIEAFAVSKKTAQAHKQKFEIKIFEL